MGLIPLLFELLPEATILRWEVVNGIEFLFFIDKTSLTFLSLVSFISRIIIFYSFSYISPGTSERFALLLFLFVSSMILLIFCWTLPLAILGWDGLGVSRFLLVCYYPSTDSFNCSAITGVMNRVGDYFLLIAIVLVFLDSFWSGILWVILAALTKRAQFPFSSWLPKAMAAPTPVSSLVHSSTLVTAGVFLIIRFPPEGNVATTLSFLAMITLTLANLAACLQNDIKKLIAMSTISHMRIIIFFISLNAINSAFIHLVVHALAKALLFIGAGVVLHSLATQDIRKIGALINSSTVLSLMTLRIFSLCALPFISGFFSKDLCLLLIHQNKINLFLFIIFWLNLPLSLAYRLRFLFYVNFKEASYGVVLQKISWDLILIRMIPLGLSCTFAGIVLMFLTPLAINPHSFILLLPIRAPMLILSSLIIYFTFLYKKVFINKLMSYIRSLGFIDMLVSNTGGVGFNFAWAISSSLEKTWIESPKRSLANYVPLI